MTNPETLALDAARPTPSADLLPRIARAAVLRKLARLRRGKIELVEGRFVHSVGDGHGDLSARLTVSDPRFYRRLATAGSLGAAEAYIDGDWHCDDLTALIRIFIRNMTLADGMDRGLARVAQWMARGWHWLRRNTRAGSRRNIEAHYDLGNDFYRLFLDETMMYSAGWFDGPECGLREASIEKIDRLCRKLELGPQDHLLEIGTGWGGLALHAAQVYGCRVTTTTISRRQYELATRRVREVGLADRVEVLLEDYRDLRGTYDKIVSCEMIEAVGHEYLGEFFGQCGRLLKPDGRLALQAIVMNEQRYDQYLSSTDFIRRHIFPGGCLPSILAMGRAVARHTDMRLVHLEDFASGYERTLQCWRDCFHAALDQVRQLQFSESFIRLWTYYLCYCEAAFAERYIGVVQVLWAKPGNACDAMQVRVDRRSRPATLVEAAVT